MRNHFANIELTRRHTVDELAEDAQAIGFAAHGDQCVLFVKVCEFDFDQHSRIKRVASGSVRSSHQGLAANKFSDDKSRTQALFGRIQW